MYTITNIKITGFWGTHQLSTKLNRDVNFFIGPNGSGKTTAINMVAAALNADFRTLDTLSFDKISIDLKDTDTNDKALIEISKVLHEKTPFPEITYHIKDKSTDNKIVDYSLNSYEEQLSFREYPLLRTSTRYFRTHPRADMSEHLKRLISVNWLSIHRAEKSRTSEQRSYESTVDQKLDDLSREFAGFFSQINKQSENAANVFQQNAFLSLISQQTEKDLYEIIPSMVTETERKALVDIFLKFNVDQAIFSPQINKHFELFESARERLLVKRKKLDNNNVIALITMLRVHLVVQQWLSLLQKQEQIFEPRNTFLKIMNSMLLGKTVEINDRNQFVAKVNPNKTFTLQQLSSGEKQLFIILGEALLQQKAPWIYIADEPELSLHVDWQTQLIDSLLHINPNAQFIVATHSPDIVSHYSTNIINMEDIIK